MNNAVDGVLTKLYDDIKPADVRLLRKIGVIKVCDDNIAEHGSDNLFFVSVGRTQITMMGYLTNSVTCATLVLSMSMKIALMFLLSEHQQNLFPHISELLSLVRWRGCVRSKVTLSMNNVDSSNFCLCASGCNLHCSPSSNKY